MVLPELLVAIVITLIIFGAAVTSFVSLVTHHRRTDIAAQAQTGARGAIDRLVILLRSSMSSGTANSQPVEQHSDFDIVFLAPSSTVSLTNNPRGLQHVRACLDRTSATNEKLWVQTTRYDSSTQPSPPSTAACPSSAWTTQDQLASNLVNASAEPLFTRTDPSGTVLAANAGNVNDVGIRALVDVDTRDTHAATQLRSAVDLRNLNRTPTASTTCLAGSNGHVVCDASASGDPDGQTLSFAWKVDNVTVTETSSRLDRGNLASGTTHTFTVTVTDPGGLTSSDTKSVTMP
jgi:hypothetical protein